MSLKVVDQRRRIIGDANSEPIKHAPVGSCLNVDKGCPRRYGPETSKPRRAPAPLLSKEQLKDMFKRFDRDNDGFLSKEELKKAFSILGSRAPIFRTHAALHHAEKNGDGYITGDELEALLQYAQGLGYTIKME